MKISVRTEPLYERFVRFDGGSWDHVLATRLANPSPFGPEVGALVSRISAIFAVPVPVLSAAAGSEWDQCRGVVGGRRRRHIAVNRRTVIGGWGRVEVGPWNVVGCRRQHVIGRLCV